MLVDTNFKRMFLVSDLSEVTLPTSDNNNKNRTSISGSNSIGGISPLESPQPEGGSNSSQTSESGPPEGGLESGNNDDDSSEEGPSRPEPRNPESSRAVKRKYEPYFGETTDEDDDVPLVPPEKRAKILNIDDRTISPIVNKVRNPNKKTTKGVVTKKYQLSKHTCRICNIDFTTREMLVKHISNTHEKSTKRKRKEQPANFTDPDFKRSRLDDDDSDEDDSDEDD